MAQTNKNQELAQKIISEVGGKGNIAMVSHCMTRLRLNLKDESLYNADKVKAIPGVIGLVKTGGQIQIIIGQTVDKVYSEFCKIGGFDKDVKIDENLDKNVKKSFSLKSIGGSIIDGLTGSLVPLIPLLMGIAMFKMITGVLGPDLLNVLDSSNDLYNLFNIVGDAGFYFLPIAVGYTAAKKFGVTPIVAMVLGGVLIHPIMIQMAADGTVFSVYGIHFTPINYTSTVLPMILSVWVMSYVEAFFKKYIPSTLKTVLVPSLSIMVMLPLSLLILGPAGAFFGDFISNLLLGIDGPWAFLGVALVGALWQYLVLSGMHLVMIAALITVFFGTGSESFVSPAALASSISVSGMALGAALRLKNKEQRSLSFGFLIAGFVGGVTEPALYGIGLKYKRPLWGMMIGGFAGGLYGALTHVTAYQLIPVASFINLFAYIGGSTANIVNAIVTAAIAFTVAAVVTYYIGFKGNEKNLEATE